MRQLVTNSRRTKKKKAQIWFSIQISRKMSRDYDSTEMEHATAVAAAAFAINSIEASEIPQQKKKSESPETSLTRNKSKVDGTKSPISLPAGLSKRFSVSFKSTDDQVRDEKNSEKAISPSSSLKKTPTFRNTEDKKPDDGKPGSTLFPKFPPLPLADEYSVPLRPPPPPLTKPSPVTARPSSSETKADAWEREELQKIKARYEKLKETIDSWEHRKKMKARRKLNQNQQREVDERKRMKALEKFQSKMKYTDEIAGGARAEADERRRNEELKAKKKANRIRTTGKLPGPCSCF